MAIVRWRSTRGLHYFGWRRKRSAIMGWCSTIPFKHLGALSTNGCGRLLHILILSGRRNACRLTFWYIGQGIVLCDLLRMQRKQGYCYKAIYNSVHHYSLVVCYTALSRSLVEYASTVWDPLTNVNIQKFESVQRRSVQFVMNDYRQGSSVAYLLNILQW
jgi:hypothetical protein